MGTSKGYIAPTTPHWSQVKRAVTSYINSGDGESRAKAASKYASAMHHDIATSEQFTKAAGSILSFAQAVSRGGINNALHEFNRNDLIGKSSDEIYNELIQDFTNYGNTTEDYLSAEAIRAALKGLNITDLGDLKDVAPDVLLKEMLIEYIKFSFAFRYEEKIRMKRNPEETERLLEKMDKYISNELHNNLKLEDIKTMDFGHLQASEVVKRSLEDAYQVFELFYGEA